MMPLFLRKNKDDKVSKKFYFLGFIKSNGYLKEFIMSNGKEGEGFNAVEIGYNLETEIKNDLFNYFIN